MQARKKSIETPVLHEVILQDLEKRMSVKEKVTSPQRQTLKRKRTRVKKRQTFNKCKWFLGWEALRGLMSGQGTSFSLSLFFSNT